MVKTKKYRIKCNVLYYTYSGADYFANNYLNIQGRDNDVFKRSCVKRIWNSAAIRTFPKQPIKINLLMSLWLLDSTRNLVYS